MNTTSNNNTGTFVLFRERENGNNTGTFVLFRERENGKTRE